MSRLQRFKYFAGFSLSPDHQAIIDDCFTFTREGRVAALEILMDQLVSEGISLPQLHGQKQEQYGHHHILPLTLNMVHSAALNRQFDIVALLRTKYGFDVNVPLTFEMEIKSNKRRSIFTSVPHIMVETATIEEMKALRDQGADINNAGFYDPSVPSRPLTPMNMLIAHYSNMLIRQDDIRAVKDDHLSGGPVMIIENDTMGMTIQMTQYADYSQEISDIEKKLVLLLDEGAQVVKPFEMVARGEEWRPIPYRTSHSNPFMSPYHLALKCHNLGMPDDLMEQFEIAYQAQIKDTPWQRLKARVSTWAPVPWG